jgi:ABC-2 type transport system permease protein
MGALFRIFWLGIKEIQSLRRDFAMAGLLVYAFTAGVYMDATAKSGSVNNASIAVVDEDGSSLSRALVSAFRSPEFKPAEPIAAADTDHAMDAGEYIFILGIPPGFERDLRAHRSPELQVLIDATAMEQAGLGAGYIQAILTEEIAGFAQRRNLVSVPPIDLVIRTAFNPSRDLVQFQGIISLIGQINILAIILTGAALIREREHGTIEHLLAMPLSPLEIALAKIWANTAVVIAAAALSTALILEGLLGVTFAGSRLLFLFGTILYLFSAAALGVFLATIARSMAQFALLFFLVILPMQMLSGADTPIESQPDWLQPITNLLPSRHFVSFGQAIVFKGAGIDIVWPEFAALTILGLVLLALSLANFRRSLAEER